MLDWIVMQGRLMDAWVGANQINALVLLIKFRTAKAINGNTGKRWLLNRNLCKCYRIGSEYKWLTVVGALVVFATWMEQRKDQRKDWRGGRGARGGVRERERRRERLTPETMTIRLKYVILNQKPTIWIEIFCDLGMSTFASDHPLPCIIGWQFYSRIYYHKPCTMHCRPLYLILFYIQCACSKW